VNPHYPFVARRARHICEYCRAPEAVFNLPFEIDHIIPLSRGGDDDQNNLALSCRSCNLYKSDSVSAFDEETQTAIRFFNPRLDDWAEHFVFDRKTGEIKSITPIAEATILRLRINSKAQLAARIQWLQLGFFN
jgi:hypothetical protein